VDEELEASLRPVLSELVGFFEDADDGLGEPEVLVGGHEWGEDGCIARHDAEATANDDLEPLDAVLDARDEPEVVDAGDGVVGIGAGEGDEFPGKELESGLQRQKRAKAPAYGVGSNSSPSWILPTGRP
jgi:hypothetical protein